MKENRSAVWPTAALFLLVLAAIMLPEAWRGRLFPHAAWVLTLLLWIATVILLGPLRTVKTEAITADIPLAKPMATLAGLLFASAGAIMLAHSLLRIWHGQWAGTPLWLWAGGLLALVIGAYLFGPYIGWRNRLALQTSGRGRVTRLEVLLFLAVLAVGLFFRLYRIRQLPPGLFVDEGNAALDALHILAGRPVSPFGTGWFETPTMYAYYLVGLFKLFGVHYLTLKLASLLPGILLLVVFYPFARDLFGPPTALAGTFFLAVSRWHAHLSRWGWNEVAPPLFQVLALYFLLRGSRSRRTGDFVLGGVFLGLGLYTYLASRLVVAVLFLYLLYRLLVEKGYARRVWPGLLAFWLAWGLTFAPLAMTYWHNPFKFFNRSRQVSVLNDMQRAYKPGTPIPVWWQAMAKPLHLPLEISVQPLWQNVVKHAQMFTIAGDRNPRHNIPGAPMLDFITGIFFLMGLGYALWRWRDHRQGLLLIWLAVTLLGGVLSSSGEAPQAYRTLGVVPAVALLAGEAFANLWTVLRRWPGYFPQAGKVFSLALLLTLPAAAWLNGHAYFALYARSPLTAVAFNAPENSVAREVQAALARGETVYLAPRLYWGSPLRVLTCCHDPAHNNVDHPPYKMVSPALDLPLPAFGNLTLLLDVDDAQIADYFRMYYPHAHGEIIHGPGNAPLYWRLSVPANDNTARHGLMSSYFDSAGKLVWQGPAAAIDFCWPEDLPAAATQAARARWAGQLRIPHSGRYTLTDEGNLIVVLDGKPWQGERFLAVGLHRLAVEARLTSGEKCFKLFWRSGSTSLQLIPREAYFHLDLPQQGLTASYFRGDHWAGEPVFSRLDRLLLFAWPEQEPWPGPFSVTWQGELRIPQDGAYYFQLDADDGVRFTLDGRVLGESLRPNDVNQVRVRANLKAGEHRLRIDYFQQGGGKALEFRWQPPGQSLRIVPPMALSPRGEK